MGSSLHLAEVTEGAGNQHRASFRHRVLFSLRTSYEVCAFLGLSVSVATASSAPAQGWTHSRNSMNISRIKTNLLFYSVAKNSSQGLL